jgi:hypothetical protein
VTALQVLTYVRYQLDDVVEPQKWLNKELAFYLNNAQDEIARRTGCVKSYPSIVSITGAGNISFNSTTKKITKASGGFLSSGGASEANSFEINDKITITGTTSNNATKTIVSVTDTEILVSESLVTESNTSAVIEATRTVSRIPIIAGVHTYKLHPSVILIMRATLDSLGYSLKQFTFTGLDDEYSYSNDEDWLISQPAWESATSEPFAYIEDNGFIRIVPTPTVDDILWLSVTRIPKLRFTDANLSLEPEIATQYHEDLMDWILHMAYIKPDPETQDMVKATFFEGSFEKKVGPRPSILTEINRKRWPPNQKMRSKSFGFGG